MNDAWLFFGVLAAIVVILFFIIAVLSGDTRPRCQFCDEYLDGGKHYHIRCYLDHNRDAWITRYRGDEKND